MGNSDGKDSATTSGVNRTPLDTNKVLESNFQTR